MKYRLIKWYPSLPDKLKEGDIVTLEVNKYYYFFETIERWEVENYPEFWEKVEEKSFEILSYKFELFFSDTEQSENSVINSIKRLSDGEIFTLGDIIDGISHRNVKINSIESNPNCNQIMFNRLDEGIDLLNARKSQQPLFTTNDGVDIHIGDTFYYVNDKWGMYDYTVNCYSSFLPSVYKTSFSTKEKAEEWVLWNKPCISLNDLHKSIMTHCASDVWDNLKEIVKSRL